MPNNRRGLFIILLLLLGLFLGLVAVRQTQLFKKKAALADSASLSFAPLSTTTYSPGNSFSVTARLNTGSQSIVGSDILVNFNSNQLSLTGITINPTGNSNLNSTSATFAPVTSTGTFDVNRVINCANNGSTSGCPSGQGTAEFGFVRFNWATNLPTTAYSTNGSTIDVATLSFQVKSTAPAGTNPIKFVFTSLSSTTDSNVTAAAAVEDILTAPTSQLNITISSINPTLTPTPIPTAGPSSTPVPTLPPGTSTVIIDAAADSYTDTAAPTTNYGTATLLGIDGAPSIKTAFFKFDLRGKNLANVTINSAKFRFTVADVTDADSTSTQNIKFVIDNSWIETGAGSITYNNRPALGSTLATNLGGIRNQTIEIPITINFSANKAEDFYGLAVDQSGAEGMDVYSKERTGINTNQKPQLVVSYSSTTISPTPTSSACTPVPTNWVARLLDFNLWLTHYNLDPSVVQLGGPSIGDFNCDTHVTLFDFNLWLTHYVP